MPARTTKTLAVALAAGLTAATLIATAGTPAVAEEGARAAAKAQTASITLLPGIAQPGKKPSGIAGAKAVVTARITPAKAGRPATLQRLSGSSWKSAGKTKTTKKGLAEFTVGTGAATYRIVAAKYKGQPAITTAQVTSGWGAPVFADQFAGGKLGPAWHHRGSGYNPHGLRRCSLGSPKAVKIKGGTAQLSVMLDKSKKNKSCTAKQANGRTIGKYGYRLNGHIATQGSADITYGVAAARIKFQRLRGQHASFWMQPTNPTGTTASTAGAEIDVIEWFGENKRDKSELTSFIYHPVGGKQKKVGSWIKSPDDFLSSKSDDWYKSYHVFSVEWTRSAYIFRIDGKETWRTTAGISGTAQFPILSLLSSDYELPAIKNEKKELPQTMDVDWVQLWQADPTTGLMPVPVG